MLNAPPSACARKVTKLILQLRGGGGLEASMENLDQQWITINTIIGSNCLETELKLAWGIHSIFDNIQPQANFTF